MVAYFRSAIGRKQLMGVTGLAWSLFVMAHMAGNLLLFAGADAYNKYSYALINNPFIFVAQAGLVATLLLHVFYAVILRRENAGARKQPYATATNGAKAARFQSKFMIFHGSLLLVFIVYHLITFKFGPHYETSVGGVVMRDLHRLVVEVFKQPAYVIGYVLCMVMVGLHLAHGFYSSFCSLGFYHPKYSPWLNRFGYVYAAIVALGFMAQPIYVYLAR